jgi:PAS domain S-box-containing protein
MADKIKSPRKKTGKFIKWMASLWDKVIEVKAENDEEKRLGRLFNTLMVISTGIVIYLAVIFLLMEPLGFSSDRWVSWLAAGFPGAFIPLSVFCLILARQGYVRPMVLLYSWVNFIGIGLAAYVFDGVYSPAWVLFTWTITIAGILVAPVYALRMTGIVIAYFITLLLLYKIGIYHPPLSLGDSGREFVQISATLIILISAVGLLTYLNMKSLREAHIKLRESENKYRKIFENVQDIFYQTDIAGNIREISPSIERYAGFKREELLGTPVANVYINPQDREGLLKVITERGEVVDYELELKSKNDRLIYTSVNAHLLLDPAGKPIGIEGSLRDITARKKAEEELLNLSRKNELILASLGEGVYGVNLNGDATFINPAMLQMLGYSTEELIGKQLHGIIHHSKADGTNYPADECKIYAAYRDGTTHRVNNEVFWRKDGTSFMVDYISTPIIEDNKIMGAVVVFRDITKIKQADEALRESLEKLKDLFELSPLGIALTDMDGRYVEFNEAFCTICGYPADELMKLDYWKLTPKEYEAKEAEQLESLAKTGRYGPYEKEYMQKNGLRIPIRLNGTLITGKDGKQYIWSIVEDITERKLYEEQLKEANASKDKFFSIVAHDLKNPFNALLGASEALNEGINEFNEEEIKHLSNMVNKSAKNAYALLENLLEWSRSQLGRLKFEPTDLNLRDITYESLKAIEVQAHNKRIKLINNTKSINVFADPNLLQTIIRNLLSNAIKYTNQGGTVTIGSTQTNGYIEVSVTDTGVGMPQEATEKIFKIDTKYSTPGTAKESGTGLGLILCKEFVEKHGGQIWVESEVGKGTTFTFTLPAKQAFII